MKLNPRRTLHVPFISLVLLGAATLTPAFADPAATPMPPTQAAVASVKAVVPAAPTSTVKAVIPAAVAPSQAVKVVLTTGAVLPATTVKTVVPVSNAARRRVWNTADPDLRYRSHAQWSTQQTSDSIKSR